MKLVHNGNMEVNYTRPHPTNLNTFDDVIPLDWFSPYDALGQRVHYIFCKTVTSSISFPLFKLSDNFIQLSIIGTKCDILNVKSIHFLVKYSPLKFTSFTSKWRKLHFKVDKF